MVKFSWGLEETAWMDSLIHVTKTETKEAEAEVTKPKESNNIDFKVGDNCRAMYLEEEYEAKIKSIDKTENGQAYCFVRFVGYGNEESVWMEELKPSKGKEARDEQRKVASATQQEKAEEKETAKVDEENAKVKEDKAAKGQNEAARLQEMAVKVQEGAAKVQEKVVEVQEKLVKLQERAVKGQDEVDQGLSESQTAAKDIPKEVSIEEKPSKNATGAVAHLPEADRRELEELRKENAALRRDKGDLAQQNEALKKGNLDLKAMVNSTTSSSESVAAEIEVGIRNLRMTNEKLSEAEAKLAQAESKCAKLQAELEQVTKREANFREESLVTQKQLIQKVSFAKMCW